MASGVRCLEHLSPGLDYHVGICGGSRLTRAPQWLAPGRGNTSGHSTTHLLAYIPVTCTLPFPPPPRCPVGGPACLPVGSGTTFSTITSTTCRRIYRWATSAKVRWEVSCDFLSWNFGKSLHPISPSFPCLFRCSWFSSPPDVLRGLFASSLSLSLCVCDSGDGENEQLQGGGVCIWFVASNPTNTSVTPPSPLHRQRRFDCFACYRRRTSCVTTLRGCRQTRTT